MQLTRFQYQDSGQPFLDRGASLLALLNRENDAVSASLCSYWRTYHHAGETDLQPKVASGADERALVYSASEGRAKTSEEWLAGRLSILALALLAQRLILRINPLD